MQLGHGLKGEQSETAFRHIREATEPAVDSTSSKSVTRPSWWPQKISTTLPFAWIGYSVLLRPLRSSAQCRLIVVNSVWSYWRNRLDFGLGAAITTWRLPLIEGFEFVPVTPFDGSRLVKTIEFVKKRGYLSPSMESFAVFVGACWPLVNSQNRSTAKVTRTARTKLGGWRIKITLGNRLMRTLTSGGVVAGQSSRRPG